MFCKVLELNPDICKRLVEVITGRVIRHIVRSQTQKEIQITDNNRGVRLDVVFDDDEESVYNIEMQNYHEPAPLKRARYYQSMVDLSILERGEPFTELKDSYIIFISLEDYFKAGKSLYRFECTCSDLPAAVNDGTHKIFVNTAGAVSGLSPEFEHLLAFLKGQGPCDGFTDRIADAVRTIKHSEHLRRQYMTIQEKIEKEKEQSRLQGRNEVLAELQLSEEDLRLILKSMHENPGKRIVLSLE